MLLTAGGVPEPETIDAVLSGDGYPGTLVIFDFFDAPTRVLVFGEGGSEVPRAPGRP